MKRKQPQPTDRAHWTVTGNVFAAPTPLRTCAAFTDAEREQAVRALLKEGFERITIVSVPG